jgi:aerobic-type carbon monoxide dehydrogenase small subunit (CoxS/CutS family)/CO/xanthine dehydrogenase FAD-binding subunit
MLARGIRSYHRPTRLDEALALAAEGAAPLAGGTRLLAAERDLPNLLDLLGLGLAGARLHDEDLEIGAMTTLEEVLRSPEAYGASAALLPGACRASIPWRLLRGMATLGGEAIVADPDSELVAALLALNAIFVVARKDGSVEVPALRFLRQPAADLSGGALLTTILIPGAPDGAAVARAAALPSLPPLVAVVAATTHSGDKLSRVRLAVTGLDTPPSRILEAEGQLERSAGEERAIEQAADLVARLAPFRDDASATAAQRRRIARPLVLRAVRASVERGRRREPERAPSLRPLPPPRLPGPMPYFTSGRLELSVNGRVLHAEVGARTTLSELLRGTGAFGVKAGCATGRCGACTVLLDGQPVAACLTLAVRAQGRAVTTIEGLGTPERPHLLQAAFAASGAAQCGFCTPALVLSSRALLDTTAQPTEHEVREELTGLCRCGGYARAIGAVRAARRSS